MTEEQKPAHPKSVAEDKANSAPKITRRRFTKAGVVAPLIMTLGSRPVWGDQCTTLSGMQSGNTSDADDPERHLAHGSLGYPASYWICHPSSEWLGEPGTYEIFDPCATTAPSVTVNIYQPNDLWEALAAEDEETREVAAAIVNFKVYGDDFGYTDAEITSLANSMQNDADFIEFLSCLNRRSVGADGFVCPPQPTVAITTLKSGTDDNCFNASGITFYMIDGSYVGVGTDQGPESCPECDQESNPEPELPPVEDKQPDEVQTKTPKDKPKPNKK